MEETPPQKKVKSILYYSSYSKEGLFKMNSFNQKDMGGRENSRGGRVSAKKKSKEGPQ